MLNLNTKIFINLSGKALFNLELISHVRPNDSTRKNPRSISDSTR